MVRNYGFLPVFYEASGNLGLQPFARKTTSNPIRPRAMSRTQDTRVLSSLGP